MSLSATPVRRLYGMLSALALAAVGLLVMPTAAFASSPAYPAPSVDPAVQAGVPAVQTEPGIALASNSGSDFTIGMPFVIGAVVLLVGLALLIMMTRPSKAKHYRR
jgi:hypothetical protein